MAAVAERHPEQTLMLCASGGGRVDLGSLRWFHEVWLSDNTDPVDRVRMQWAASHFLPANAVAAHVTRLGDRPIAFGCAVAMSARFGFDVDFEALTGEELGVCRRAVALYREVRPLVQQGDLWRLLPPESAPPSPTCRPTATRPWSSASSWRTAATRTAASIVRLGGSMRTDLRGQGGRPRHAGDAEGPPSGGAARS